MLATEGDPITISGSGFLANEPIVLSLRVDPNLAIIAGGARGAQVAANEAGAFSISFERVGGAAASQARAIGFRSFVAEGVDGSRASAPVEIVGSPAATTAVDTSLLAGAALVGETFAVYGAGFGAEEAVTILAVAAAAEGADRILAGATANASGAFEVESPNPLAVGIYTLRAVGNQGSSATAVLKVHEEK